jgi:hypothetical protein
MFTDLNDLIEQYNADEKTNLKDDTNINQVILYYDDSSLEELKRLAKEAMRQEFPMDFQKQNLSTILLHLLKKHYGSKEANIETQNAFI